MRVGVEDSLTHLGACFQAKEREGTAWLSITHAVGDPNATAAVNELRTLGWQTQQDRGFRGAPPLPIEGVETVETQVSKPGTALFGGWTESEKRKNLAEARRVLKKHGYGKVDLVRLPWQEFM